MRWLVLVPLLLGCAAAAPRPARPAAAPAPVPAPSTPALATAAAPPVAPDPRAGERSVLVRRAEPDPAFRAHQGTPFLDIEACDATLEEVVKAVNDAAYLGLRVDPRVRERVTLSLRGVPWRVALEAVARRTGCLLGEG